MLSGVDQAQPGVRKGKKRRDATQHHTLTHRLDNKQILMRD